MIRVLEQGMIPVRVWTGQCEHCKSKFAAHDKDVAQGSGMAFVLKDGCPICGYKLVCVGTSGNPFEPYPTLRPPSGKNSP